MFHTWTGPDAGGTRHIGHEAVRAAFQKAWRDFPDAQWTRARHVVAGSRGVSEWTFVGTRASDGRRVEVGADFVLALTGYAPRLDLFDQLGVAYDSATKRPVLDPATHESSVPGVYVAGCICAGNIGNEIFIENGRTHGAPIVAHAAAARRG